MGNEIKKYHDFAMSHAELAYLAKLERNDTGYKIYIRKAFEAEKIAALLMESNYIQPTRSVLYRSAASLAMNCNEIKEAEDLIFMGCTINTPTEIRKEFEDLLKEIKQKKVKGKGGEGDFD